MAWKIAATVCASVGGLLGFSTIYSQLGLDLSWLGKSIRQRSPAIRAVAVLSIGLPTLLLSRLGVIPTQELWRLLPGYVPFVLSGAFTVRVFFLALRRLVRALPKYRASDASQELREVFQLAVPTDLLLCCLVLFGTVRQPDFIVEWLAFGLIPPLLVLGLGYCIAGTGMLVDWLFRGRIASTTLAVLLLLASTLIQIWRI